MLFRSMLAPYPTNRFQNQHPHRLLRIKAGSPAIQDSGGQFSTPIPRFRGAKLHAGTHLGLKTVQMVHGEGSKEQKMDSLIKKLWFLHRANEMIALTIADRVLCVNPNIITRLKSVLPRAVHKAEVMTVSVDMRKFALRPFDLSDGVFRVVFAGRDRKSTRLNPVTDQSRMPSSA